MGCGHFNVYAGAVDREYKKCDILFWCNIWSTLLLKNRDVISVFTFFVDHHVRIKT